MIGLRSLTRVNRLCGKVISLRFRSTDPSLKENNETSPGRQFLRSLILHDVKPFKEDFVRVVYGGGFDLDILEYPQIFGNNDIDVIHKHGQVLEEFVKVNPTVQLSKEVIQRLKKLELFGLSVPQQYGGAGYTETEINFLLECSSQNYHIGRFIGRAEDFGVRIIKDFGTEEQKNKYLPILSKGDALINLAYLEKHTLAELYKYEAVAVLHGTEKKYVLKATKQWVPHADMSDYFLVFTKILSYDDTKSETRFGVLLVDKNTPGIKIKKIENPNTKDFNFYEVDFEEIFVPEENLIGGLNICGFQALKHTLSHGFLTDAVFCCSLMKQIIFSASNVSSLSKLLQEKMKGYKLVEDNLSLLTMYLYALESSIYLLSGRFDLHTDYDFFFEAILVKVFAIEMLKLSINKYIEITGFDDYKSSGILDKAINFLHYYTVMDENLEQLKIILGSNGLCFAGPMLNKDVVKLRNPYENFTFKAKTFFTSKNAFIDKAKKKFNIKMELNNALNQSGDKLEECLAILNFCLLEFFARRGADLVESEYLITKIAELVVHLYANTACLSRASNAICYEHKNWVMELELATRFTINTHNKFHNFLREEYEFTALNDFYRFIGKETFKNKDYPAEHPLTRTY